MLAFVGDSSKGRKGTSFSHVRRLIGSVDPDWSRNCVVDGLASGEGLIWHVRDPAENEPADVASPARGRPRKTDPGVEDKRLCVVEGEFAKVIKIIHREGNTLSPVIRDAWDRGDLRSLSKNSPGKATGAHISILGHITRDELTRCLAATEASNGFANRFLWVAVRRSKCLPEGGRLHEVDLAPLLSRLREAVEHARRCEEKIVRDDEARELWAAVYPDLSVGRPGILGAVTARAEAQVMRLSVLHALLDRSPRVRRVHVEAALAFWDYSFASARWVFGTSLGDPVADEIHRELAERAEGMSRSEIRDFFGRHERAERITRALNLLHTLGKARVDKRADTGGRPEEVWYAA